MKLSRFSWIFLVGLICINSFNQVLASEALVSSYSNNANSMSVQDFRRIITENRPQIDVAIAGEKRENISVTASPSLANEVFSLALDTFTRSDSMLRMIIDENRLKSLKGENFVSIKFKQPVILTIAYGGGKALSVSKIVIPLPVKQISSEWSFYYYGESRDWFALVWTRSDYKILDQLKQASQKLVRN
jgi:hypothetical protein